jgi:hypothetical protein
LVRTPVRSRPYWVGASGRLRHAAVASPQRSRTASTLDEITAGEHAVVMAIMARSRRRTTRAQRVTPTARPDYRHLPQRIDPASWVTGEDATPPNSGPRRFAFNDDVWLIERFIGLG